MLFRSVSGVTGNDTVAYDSASVSSDTYYDNGGNEYLTDDTTGDAAGDAAEPAESTDAVDNAEEAPAENTEEPAAEPDTGDAADPAETDGVVIVG